MLKILLFCLAGFSGGLLGGMGMGGGTVLIPLLTILFKVPQKLAQAINLIAFLPMGIVALIIHIKNKLVRGKNLAFIIIPACIFAVLSSFLSNHLKNQLLSKIFGGFLIFLALLQFFLDKVKKKKQK